MARGSQERNVILSVEPKAWVAAALCGLTCHLPAAAEPTARPQTAVAEFSAIEAPLHVAAKVTGTTVAGPVTQRKVGLDLSRLQPSAFGDWEPAPR